VVESYTSLPGGGAAAHDWRSIWLIPAAMASGVILLFAVLFRERRAGAEAVVAPAS
jgi:hypothetical protein